MTSASMSRLGAIAPLTSQGDLAERKGEAQIFGVSAEV